MILNRDDFRQALRNAVLDALDTAVKNRFGHLPTYEATSKRGIGATDADLPVLFLTIDQQAEALAERYDVILVDFDPLPLTAEAEL